MRIDPIELSRELISFNTINPPGNELRCILHLEKILTAAGLETSLLKFAPDRANLIARIGGAGSKAPLCFTGHVDTVPLGNAPWSVDPFAGKIIDGKMYGRGSTDMKCGVAAFVAAIGNMAKQLEGTSGAVLVITAGEEIGCEGAFHLARAGVLGRAGAIVVAEPTSNAALVGHKGALWLRSTLKGVTPPMDRCLISASTQPIKPRACSPLWKHFSSTLRRTLVWDCLPSTSALFTLALM